ncbi:aspartate/glutamate racemase family protein [Virgibacillus oceani]|uniref:Hydantoin racemase n=1 Tax=Virgibacillus oceani TaxID=1479511 RepID=A0A917M618_9BACI|nr:aspartate/glutamate racemase family protein [Virgibacillus oceani]GGG79598.1 hydantoin racemase [Virgibacillus oceani]
MIGIIRVLTTANEEVLGEHGKKMKSYYHVDSITRCIPSQPNGIYDAASEALAVPKIVSLAQELEKEEFIDAISISCAADPALIETRSVVKVPVLGAGVSGAHAASMAGNNVGVIGITEQPPIRLRNELGKRFHSYTFSPNLRKTTDLFSKGAMEELLQLAQHAIQSGSDVILFACTGFSTIGLKNYLIEKINIPIIDLVEAQAIAYQLIERRKKDAK